MNNEYEDKPIKCRTPRCKTLLHGKNEKDVGYCLECFNEMMADDEIDDDDPSTWMNELKD